MSKIPGTEILEEILNGNEKVLSSIYKKVYHHLENYGRYINAIDHNIKESVQDAFEIFYREILGRKLKLTCSVETYIISIAKRVLHQDKNRLGFFNKEPLTEFDLIEENEINQNIQEQRHRLFMSEFKKLNEECKRIITLTLEGYNSREIKQLMNFSSEDYVRIKRQRCKHYLTTKIKANPDYERLRNADPEDSQIPLW